MTGVLRAMAVLAERELRGLRHDPMDLVARVVQPVLWLALFATALSARFNVVLEGPVTYPQFILPGVLLQSVLFAAIVYGLTLKWEMDLGILQKILTMPVPRTSIVLGKVAAIIVRSYIQVVVVLFLAALLSIPVVPSPVGLVLSLVLVALFVAGFAALSMVIALLIGSREAFIGMVGIIVFPLFFLSTALYPAGLLRGWMAQAIWYNPVTYATDALRQLLLSGGVDDSAVRGFVVTGLFAGALVSVVTLLFRRRQG